MDTDTRAEADEVDTDTFEIAERTPNYYAVLGVEPAASADEVHAAYRALVKLWHPDRYAHAAPEMRARAERRMRALNRAYGVLGDASRRSRYDAIRLAGHGEGLRWGEVADEGATSVAYGDAAAHASANPNGAGHFVAALCAVLGIALLGHLVLTPDGGGWAAFAQLALLLALLAVAGIALNRDSVVARTAYSWAEGEPPGATMDEASESYGEADAEMAGDGTDSVDDADAPVYALSREEFEQAVADAVARLPAEFRQAMPNLHVRVEEEPDAETLREAGTAHGSVLLGLYHGVPLTAQGVAGAAAPEVVSIYRRPIEAVCEHDPVLIRQQVRRVVLHEVAHHFGIGHDAMPDWVW